MIGWDVKTELFPQLDPLGRTVLVGAVPFRVVGLIAQQGRTLGQSQDNQIFVPLNITSTYDPTLGEGIGVGIRQDSTELKAKIDTALCELIKDGSIKASSEKWFNMDISRPCL